MKLNLRQVEAFRAFMITGTVSKAAEIMHITQPAVSRLIGDFEYAVGFSLFDRAKRKLSPTKDCHALFKEVERTFAGLDHIESTANQIRNMQTGHLNIAAMPMLATHFLPDVIANFEALHPGIAINLTTWPREQALDWMLSQQYDLGFVTLPVDDNALIVEPFPVSEAFCILPLGHKLCSKDVIQASDLRGENFISLARGIHFRHVIDQVFRENNVQVNSTLEVSSTSIICELVSRGLGVSIIGLSTINEHTNSGIVTRPFRPLIPYELGMVFPKQHSISKIARGFADTAHQTFKEKGRDIKA